MDPNTNTPIVVLKGIDSDTILPIWVGAYEANAIALEIEKIVPQRPMTHDLLQKFYRSIRFSSLARDNHRLTRKYILCVNRIAR